MQGPAQMWAFQVNFVTFDVRWDVILQQWRRKAGKLGGLSVAVFWLLIQSPSRGVWGHAPQENFEK